MSLKFETYNKSYYSTSRKIVLAFIILFAVASLFLTLILFKSNSDFAKFTAAICLIISILLCFAYGIISINSKKFISNGHIEFLNSSIIIKTENSEIIIQKEIIIKLTVYIESYDGEEQASIAAHGNVMFDGMGNRFFISTSNSNFSKKFYINNRNQIIALRKILTEWKSINNINIHFTNRKSKNYLSDSMN